VLLSAAETNAPAAKGASTNAPGVEAAARPRPSTSAGETNSPASMATTNAPPQLDYAHFRVISERNIFNQNRSPRSRSGRNQGGPRSPRYDSFTLVGMMSYGKGDVAFFDGSGSEYRKSLKRSETIAGYKLTVITNDGVTLEAGGKTVELHVGSQMRREEGGEWELAGGAHAVSAGDTTNSTASAKEGGSGHSTDNSSSGAADDVLQRLLKKREQELNDEKP
jgi:hypothetical protein